MGCHGVGKATLDVAADIRIATDQIAAVVADLEPKALIGTQGVGDHALRRAHRQARARRDVGRPAARCRLVQPHQGTAELQGDLGLSAVRLRRHRPRWPQELATHQGAYRGLNIQTSSAAGKNSIDWCCGRQFCGGHVSSWPEAAPAASQSNVRCWGYSCRDCQQP
jgi:hypothetical protein